MIHVLPGHRQLRCPRRCRGCRGCRGGRGCRGWCGRGFSQLTLEKHQLHRGTHLGAVRTTWSPGWKKVIQNDPNGWSLIPKKMSFFRAPTIHLFTSHFFWHVQNSAPVTLNGISISAIGHHQMTWYDSGCFCRQNESKHLQCFSKTRWIRWHQFMIQVQRAPAWTLDASSQSCPKKSSKAFPRLASFSHGVSLSTTESAWNCPLHTERPLGVVKINCESGGAKGHGSIIPFLFAQLRSEKSVRKQRLWVAFHVVMYQGCRI